MFLAKKATTTQDFIDNYNKPIRYFSSRLDRFAKGNKLGFEVAKGENGVFTITVTQDLIDNLEASKYFKGGEVVEAEGEDKYTWKSGDEISLLISPSTNGDLWEDYSTWKGSKLNDALKVFTLGEAEVTEEKK